MRCFCFIVQVRTEDKHFRNSSNNKNKNSSSKRLHSKSHVFQAKFCPPVLWHHAIPCQAIFRQQPSAGCGRKKGPGWCAGVGKTYSSSLILVSIYYGDVRLKLHLLAEVFKTLLFQYVSTYLQTCGILLILMPPWDFNVVPQSVPFWCFPIWSLN